MATLLFKIGTLFVNKVLAKPLANRFQAWALTHPTARPYVIKSAQVIHEFEIFLTRTFEGKKGKAFVGSMSEEHSIELASKVASEGFIVAVAVGALMADWQRSAWLERRKKAAADAERRQLLERAQYEQERLAKENQEQQEKILWLMHRVDQVERSLNDYHAQQATKRSWGGFFGPRGLAQAGQS